RRTRGERERTHRPPAGGMARAFASRSRRLPVRARPPRAFLLLRDHASDEPADALDLDLDRVAILELRDRLPRPAEDHVARLERDRLRDLAHDPRRVPD